MRYSPQGVAEGVVGVALLVPLSLYVAHRLLAPVPAMFRALAGTVMSYRDGDFSFSLAWRRYDELGELVDHVVLTAPAIP